MRIIPALVLFLAAFTFACAAETVASKLPRSTPEEQGISSTAILQFIEASEQKLDELHSFMLVRHGNVVAEGWWAPYAAPESHVMFSLSKSFTSTAVGLAVAEGLLSIDDPVLKFFPEEAPAEPSTNLKAMRVRDLLTMSTGHHNEEIAGFPYHTNGAVKRFLALPVAHKPGTHFVYNTPATFMQSAIVQKLTGQSVLEYLGPRLFAPLGIAHPQWDANPAGISMGGFGLHITTEDIAKFGQLYLQKGKWHSKQLVPAAWIEQATSKQVSNGSDPSSDWEQGYGFQFWRSKHGSYRGDGAFGQYCLVLEKYDTVIAITSGTRNMGAVMNLVWEMILPALASSEPRPADHAAQEQLKKKLASLSLPMPKGQASAPMMAGIAGRRYAFPENPQKIESITLNAVAGGEAPTLTWRMAGKEQTIAAGNGVWAKGELTTIAPGTGAVETNAIGASGAWSADHIYSLKVVRYRTPFSTTYTLRFAGNELLLDAEVNAGFGERKAPQLIGKAE